MNKILALAAATLVLATMASCTAIRSSSTPEPQPSAAAPDTVTPPSSAPEPPAQPDLTVGFGEAITYEDGVSIVVGAPSPYTPTEYAAGADFPNNLAISITVTNGTTGPLDAYAFTTMTSGGQSGSQIFDSNTSYPSGTILPGQAITWIEYWSVADPNALVFTINAGFSYEDAIYTNVA